MAEIGTFAQAKLNVADAKKALAQIDKDFERATMYGIRAAGRSAKQTAKRNAPVYSAGGLYDYDRRAVPGLLKDSIHSSKRLRKNGPNSYTLLVGPWGPKVNLYRGKANQRKPFMEPAFREVQGKMAAAFVKAYTRVLEKRGRL